jgi:NAD-dependent dihydropyrimidine dehydrogenase PreA subunit
VYVITTACVDIKDKSCMRECPVDCIYEGDRQMYIHPDECIDCGACEPVCPAEAIYYEFDLSPEEEWSRQAAADLLSPLGPLGGARKHGALHTDDPRVSALPAAAVDA